jgi:hypothetical protein
MTIHRNAARADGNRGPIVAAFQAAGAYVVDLRRPVDILVGCAGVTALVEIKVLTGKRDPKPAPRTAAQIKFFNEWPGGILSTVTDADGALRLVRIMREIGRKAAG